MCCSCNVTNKKMEPNKNKISIDPDYETNNTALRKIEEKEQEEGKLTSEKLSKIISEEFDKELSIRQKQLEEIEEKVCKAQKLLHLVRYVLVTSYYNKKGLEYTSTGEESGITSVLGAQNRIHPAVKKLLGSNANLEILNSRGKRRVQNKNSDNEASTSQTPTVKKIKLEKKGDLEENSKCQLVDSNQNSFNRKKTRHRIVIGNISKWMPSLENDNTTHKWMVYVRGLKETLDISSIIEKVVFYLHPSYKPHDVVEISNCPFHLSRRGWGEFPLRVQIFFKCPLNKPVSIVHNLKLDKTYTGRQTLGNETIVDLYLHDDNFPLNQEQNEEMYDDTKQGIKNSEEVIQESDSTLKKIPKIEVDEEPVHVKMETELLVDFKPEVDISAPDLASSSFEHNYCHEELVEKEIVNLESVANQNFSLFDHSYSLPYEEYNNDVCDQYNDKIYTNAANDQQNNNLIFGLDDSYAESGTKCVNSDKNEERVDPPKDKCIVRTYTTANGQPIRFLPQSFNSVLLNNGNIIQIKLLSQSPQSSLKHIDSNGIPPQNMADPEKPIDYEKYKLTLPKNRFKSMGEALPYLFKMLSLWNDLADDLDFKCTYPFVANSEVEFMSWNIGKKLNSEWSRAKAIKRILSAETFPDFERWNTKTFFMYGRSHGYSPFASFGTIFKKRSMELELLMSCFSKSLPREQFSLRNVDVDVDVTTDMETDEDSSLPQGKSRNIDISDNTTICHSSFIKEAVLDCGIVLKPEEIVDGVDMNAAERMIFEAVKCFADHLIRRARHHLVCQEDFSEETSEITTEEIKIALNERSELRSIMSFQKRKREMDFFL